MVAVGSGVMVAGADVEQSGVECEVDELPDSGHDGGVGDAKALGKLTGYAVHPAGAITQLPDSRRGRVGGEGAARVGVKQHQLVVER